MPLSRTRYRVDGGDYPAIIVPGIWIISVFRIPLSVIIGVIRPAVSPCGSGCATFRRTSPDALLGAAWKSQQYRQKSDAFCCGGRWSEREAGAVSRASSGFIRGYLALSGNQYRSVLHDIHRAAIGDVFRVGYRVPFQPRFNQTPVGVLINWRNGRFRHNDFFRRVVIIVARFF